MKIQMKILRYLIFISILCSIFFVIYRQSDKKGFRRWRTSFKTAIIFSVIAAGLIPVNSGAIEPPGNNNQVYQERLLLDQEFNSFEDNDQKVILVKTGDSGPSVPTSPGRAQPNPFPTPPSGGRPSRNVPGVNPYRVAPKVLPRVGAAANPAGAGGGGGNAEFDDDKSPAPKKQQSQESKTSDYDYNYQSKKEKQSAEQCELDENELDEKVKGAKVEIVHRIKENPALVREAERAGRDQAAQRSINNLIEQLSLGNQNPGIGIRNVFKDIYELRGKNGGRVYYREVEGRIEILAKSAKSNQQKVIHILKKIYG